MKIPQKRAAIVCLLLTSVASKAATIHADPSFALHNLSGFGVGTEYVIASDVNHATGQYVVCSATNNSTDIRCSQRNADDTLVQELTVDGTAQINYDRMDVELNNAGDVYLLWSTSSAQARMAVFDNLGAPIFPTFNVFSETLGDPQPWQSLSLALTPSGFWVVGSRLTTNGQNTNLIRRYNHSALTVGIQSAEINPAGTELNCNATVTANPSGDLLITWVQPDQINSSFNECRGQVVSRLFRESGLPLNDYKYLSGTDFPAFFGNPSAAVDQHGDFIAVWDELDPSNCGTCHESFYSTLSVITGTATNATAVVPHINPRVAAGSQGATFAVLTDAFTASCFLHGRFILHGQLNPEASFSPPQCFDQMIDAVLLPDASMLMLYAAPNPGAQWAIHGRRYYMPAEIEISDVSLLEGNPIFGQGPVAVVTATLNRPHPGNDTVNVDFFTREITATQGVDYPLTTGTLSFAGGQVLQEIEVPILPDDAYERDETFSVNLELADNAVIRVDEALVTILNDDATPPVNNDCDNIGGLCKTIAEPLPGNPELLEITLSIAAPEELDIAFTYETEDGTATAGSDYLYSSGIVNIPAGSTETTVSVTILGDLTTEGTEQFRIVFTTASDVTLVQPILEIGITDGTLCGAELSPIGHNVPLAGGTRSFDIDTLPGCQWTLATAEDWIHFTTPTSGTGDATVEYTVDARSNPDVYTRFGEIDVNLLSPVSQVTHTVEQDGDPSLCDFTLGQQVFDFDETGGTGSFTVSAVSECGWQVFSDDAWLTITAPTGPTFGDGVVQFSVTHNTGAVNVATADRSSVLDAPFLNPVTVNQNGCSYALSATSIDVGDGAQSGLTTSVIAPDMQGAACPWSAVSNASWILINSGHFGEGFGEVVLSVLENPSVTPRIGTVQIGDDIFTVNQQGQPCLYDIDPSAWNVCAAGTTDLLGVLATAGCGWTLDSDQPWLQVNTNAAGVGDEIAEVQVLANDSESNRSALLTLNSDDLMTQINKNVLQSGHLLYEDFSAGTLPAAFVVSPAGAWSVDQAQLSGALLGGGAGFAIDGNASSYCSDCKVSGQITQTTFSSTPLRNIGLVGWYQSPLDHVALAMDELTNRWRLSAFVNGSETFVESQADSLIPHQTHQLEIRYDAQFFYGSVDGETLLQLPHNRLLAPVGYAGFLLNNANGRMDDLRITGQSADADLISTGGFEVPQFLAPTACALQ